MALTDSQLNQLVAAQPFISTYEWSVIDGLIADGRGQDTDEFFSDLLAYATESLSWMQYALEEADELLINMPSRLSGQIRPAANTITTLETAGTVRLLCAGLTVINTAVADELLTVYHVKSGATAADGSIVYRGKIAESLAGPSGIPLNIPLQTGELLQAKSQNGTLSISSYVF